MHCMMFERKSVVKAILLKLTTIIWRQKSVVKKWRQNGVVRQKIVSSASDDSGKKSVTTVSKFDDSENEKVSSKIWVSSKWKKGLNFDDVWRHFTTDLTTISPGKGWKGMKSDATWCAETIRLNSRKNQVKHLENGTWCAIIHSWCDEHLPQWRWSGRRKNNVKSMVCGFERAFATRLTTLNFFTTAQ